MLETVQYRGDSHGVKSAMNRVSSTIVLGILFLASISVGFSWVVVANPAPRSETALTETPHTHENFPTLTPSPESLASNTSALEINPLTGLMVDSRMLNRAPLAVKISNAPPIVRPQRGLELADIVYEHLTEGTLTRFTAIFYTHTPEVVGSVRSARLIDLEIGQMYQALFAYSGASGPIRERIGASPIATRAYEGVSVGGALYYRDDSIEIPHNLFVRPAEVWEQANTQGENQRPTFSSMVFDVTPAPFISGTPTQIKLDYGAETVRWDYDASTGRYVRYINDVLHTDFNGNPLTTANVVVVWAHHQPDYTIVESEWQGNVSYSIEIQIWTLGPATIFRDGLRYDGNWHRWDKNAMLTFWTNESQQTPLPLKPGNSWFEVVPLDFQGFSTN